MKPIHLLYLLLLIISCKKNPQQLTKITAKTIAIDSTINSSHKIDSLIQPYKKKLTSDMQQVLSYASKDFLKEQHSGQSAVGNLLADLWFDSASFIFKEKTDTSIDFALFNYGGIRATIPKGKVTVERAFKLMPFENELVVVTLTGNKVIELVNFFINDKRAHPISKNIELIVNNSEYFLKINGKDFDKNKSYTVLTSDYLQGGGDNMVFFKNPESLVKLDYKARTAIIDYFEKTDTLKAGIDNRVIIK
ncbi:5'-nucleotidase [Tenacibaculum sp. 190130A14a]|uniref:UDP-sugar hydrolase n=1 Tax=Tenacibaculum polynesiense TaxID=3137857 RepID=A0ABP1F408_9FLAO